MEYPLTDRRLGLIASLVPQGSRLADIGTDHGHLVTALVASGRVQSAVAADLRPGPLAAARASGQKLPAALRGRISYRLGDGLEALAPGEADVIVLAGMGGELIWQLIDRCPFSRDAGLLFLLQPMTRAEELRAGLAGGGFVILAEDCVIQAGRSYTVLSVRYDGVKRHPDALALWAGRVMEAHTPERAAYLSRQCRTLEKRIFGLRRAGQDARAQEYEAALSQMRRWIGEEGT